MPAKRRRSERDPSRFGREVGRQDHLAVVRRQLRRQPVVALLGPRQIGKTTLARAVADTAGTPVTTFDLEHPADMRRLDDEATALQDLRGLVVIDEVQRRPGLFPVLRVLADRPRRRVASSLVARRLPAEFPGPK